MWQFVPVLLSEKASSHDVVDLFSSLDDPVVLEISLSLRDLPVTCEGLRYQFAFDILVEDELALDVLREVDIDFMRIDEDSVRVVDDGGFARTELERSDAEFRGLEKAA